MIGRSKMDDKLHDMTSYGILLDGSDYQRMFFFNTII